MAGSVRLHTQSSPFGCCNVMTKWETLNTVSDRMAGYCHSWMLWIIFLPINILLPGYPLVFCALVFLCLLSIFC